MIKAKVIKIPGTFENEYSALSITDTKMREHSVYTFKIRCYTSEEEESMNMLMSRIADKINR